MTDWTVCSDILRRRHMTIICPTWTSSIVVIGSCSLSKTQSTTFLCFTCQWIRSQQFEQRFRFWGYPAPFQSSIGLRSESSSSQIREKLSTAAQNILGQHVPLNTTRSNISSMRIFCSFICNTYVMKGRMYYNFVHFSLLVILGWNFRLLDTLIVLIQNPPRLEMHSSTLFLMLKTIKLGVI